MIFQKYFPHIFHLLIDFYRYVARVSVFYEENVKVGGGIEYLEADMITPVTHPLCHYLNYRFMALTHFDSSSGENVLIFLCKYTTTLATL